MTAECANFFEILVKILVGFIRDVLLLLGLLALLLPTSLIKNSWWHFKSRVNSLVVVVVNLKRNRLNQLTLSGIAIWLIHFKLKLLIKRFLPTVLPWTALAAH